MKESFTILEHPADLGIEAYGSTIGEAFKNVAIGLMSIILDLSTVDIVQSKKIFINASDREQLLVKWLSEILYLYDGQQFICKEFLIDKLSVNELSAIVKGEIFSNKKHKTKMDVKAVTYHKILVEENTDRGLVRVFLDI